MTPADFLKGLLQEGIRLRLEGDRLISDAPPGVLTPERVAEIRERKEDVIAFLARGGQGGTPTPPPVKRLSRGARAPLSFAQQRLWFLDRIEERSDLYNMPMALELTGRLEKEVLRKSIGTIVSRHDVLRTTFPNVDGVPYQAISPDSATGCWEWKETEVGDEANEGELAELLRAEAWRPFDLAAGPLVRVGLFCRSEENHVLQVVMHHSVSDGWSEGVFRRELSNLYAAFLSGDPSPLSPLPVQYADYAAWQREWLQGEVLEEQLAYWRGQLAGLAPLELPADRPRPPVQSFRGGTHGLRLGSALAGGLRALSRQEGSTLFMTLLTAFQLLLHRYSGQADIAVGTPIAGRNRTEFEGLMGMFVNTLVIRSDLSGDLSFRELLGRVRDTSLEAHAHQDLPFEKLVEELQPQRDLSRNPLFQVMFVLQNTPNTELAIPGLGVRSLAVGGAISRTDLSLSLWETREPGEGRTVEGFWAYATDLFDDRTIERMQGHFEVLLEGIVADPDAPVSDLALMGEEERRRLGEWSSGPELDVSRGVCIHQLFEARVAEDPDRVAVVAEDGSMTYGELESRANRLARHLVGLGVKGETLVGVSLPRTTDMVVAVMGILKAGGAYLPLDPDLPRKRLGYMLEDGGAAVLVTTTEVLESFPPFAGGVVCVDGDRQAIASYSEAPPEGSADPDHLAYVLYTSGSTGRPKGVEVCHHNVVNFVVAMGDRLRFSAEDILLAVTPLFFDPSVVHLFGPLSWGGRLVLAPEGLGADGNRLRALVEESGINLMGFAPSVWRTLLKADWQGDKKLRAWMGGEVVSPDFAKEVGVKCGEVWNMYGPTEATIAATGWQVPQDVEEMLIGTPLGNCQTYVLDPRMRLVPAGVPGELYIGGAGVARGYRDRSELTEERFVPDPFGEKPGARLYRTGDRARFHDDGTLEFMGRLDDQVKVRGLRIELGEIEARLVEHESVRQAAVMVYGEGIDARLVAYVVFETGQGLTSTEVRRFLRRTLPDYMVPNLLIELDELPLTSSGKVDRRALPDPLPQAGRRVGTNQPPETAEERLIAEVWQDLLETDRISRTDNFYEIGGHSLLSIRAVSDIEKLTGRRLDPRRFFFQTVEQLARSLTVESQAE